MCTWDDKYCAKSKEPEELPLWIDKTYELIGSENFEEYMKAIGVGPTLRKMANSVEATYRLEAMETDDDISYKLIIWSPYKESSITFKPHKRVIEETIDGRTVDTMFVFEEECLNRLLEFQCGEKGTKILREFGAEFLVVTYTVDDIQAKRVFQAKKPDDPEKISPQIEEDEMNNIQPLRLSQLDLEGE